MCRVGLEVEGTTVSSTHVREELSVSLPLVIPGSQALLNIKTYKKNLTNEIIQKVPV
jgi:hypothetical protein